jgi:AsmA family/AsmA-like C-terminal region
MKVWKSPVLYFGIFLVLAVVGLLAAPFVIDWNSYRADIESNGRKLTGRAVTVDGNVSARLFPWPRLTVEGLRIANPAGMENAEFAIVDRAVIRMSLAGLMGGNIEVESIEVERPVITLERRDGGDGNWVFAPSESVVNSDMLRKVRLDRITVTDGTLRFVDRRRGETYELTDVNAALSASGIAGPWRLHALDGRKSVARYGDRDFDMSLTTAAWIEGEPLRLGLRVSPADAAGPIFSFDGRIQAGKAEGEVRVAPAETPEGKTNSEGQLRPLVFTSQVTADFDGAAFDRIEISPANIQEGGTLVSGTASLSLDRHISASADLSAVSLDLDELAGARARNLLREGGVLSLAGGLLALIPEDVSLSAAMRVTSLTIGGERLDNAAVVVDADRNAIRLKELSTSLPGRSRVLYEGVFFPGTAGAEVAGSLALESGDLRQLSAWIWPAAKPSIERLWTGSRGQFKMQTDLSITPSRLRFSKTDYELDGERGTAELTLTSGGRTAVDLRLDAGRLDFDSLSGGSLTALAGAGSFDLAGLIGRLVPRGDAADVKLELKARELRLNGVTAADVAIDLASGVTGLDLRTLEIGSVGGARLKATGLILGGNAGPDGSIGVEIVADDPRELLRLAGLIKGESDPAWAAELGRTALKGTVAVGPKDGGIETGFDVNGTAGDISLAITGQIDGGATPDAMRISGSSEIGTGSSARMAALVGLAPVGDDQQPARLVATFDGTPGQGFRSDLQLDAFGGRHGYRGLINPFAPGLGLDGKLEMRATDVGTMARAMGLPLQSVPSGVLVIDAPVKTEGGEIRVADLSGRLGDASLKGNLSLAPGMVVKADLQTGPMHLVDLLSAAFLEWRGAAPSRESSFAVGLPLGITGEFWITPSRLTLHEHLVADGALVGIVATGAETRFTLRNKDDEGRDTKLEIGAAGGSGTRAIDGSLTLPVNLGTDLARADGGSVAEGQGAITLSFKGEGRSPAGVLAAVTGAGSYSFNDVAVAGLEPDAFIAAVDAASDGKGLTVAFDLLRKGKALDFGYVAGPVTIADGAVRFAPFVATTPQAKVEVTVVGELALNAIDADIAVAFPGRAGLPGLSIAYAGVPDALVRSEDMAELSTRLGVTIMQQGIDELERLQREQERLAREEEQQRKLDEERLQAYYAQRDELILRRRELRIHSEMRAYESERMRQRIEADREANAAISKDELRQRMRELKTFRQQAKLTRAAVPVQVVRPKPKAAIQKLNVPKPKKPAAPKGPVILVQPEGAPVVISPPPSGSPSQ